jgi:hypothetical protein
VKTASSISGNSPFLLGPMKFFCDASHSLIAALCFRHSQTSFNQLQKLQRICSVLYPLCTEQLYKYPIRPIVNPNTKSSH